MVDFENQHLSIIEQYEASALDIERIFLLEDTNSAENTILCYQFSLFLYCIPIGKDLCRILLDFILNILIL